jgi:hypothetical protein
MTHQGNKLLASILTFRKIILYSVNSILLLRFDTYDDDLRKFIKNKKQSVRIIQQENTDRYFHEYADTVILTTI